MFYMISYATRQILRDDAGNPLLSELNDSQEIKDAIKKHGALWLEFVSTKNYRRPPKAALTPQDLLYIQTLQTQDTSEPVVQTLSLENSSGGLFDFM